MSRLDLPRPIIVCKDRAPKPDELQHLLDVADLREKVIISMLALAGFREGTLVRLRYHHVREDLKKGNVPPHIHVETKITKGKYHDYDTFLAAESVEYLQLCLEARRQGNIHPEIKAEEIIDDSPLIRDEMYEFPRPIGEKQLYKLIHSLYFKAGLLRKNYSGSYDLRVHSLRKFFKTQLMALGVQSDYIDYMMGHTVDTYHDIQSKGVEFLRSIYAGASLSIRPRSGISKIDMVKEFARGLGLNPEEILVHEALSEPDMKYVDPEE
jgi:integrase